ncbi:MAG: ferredoxin [Patescibacteria group bacterium]
MEKQVKIVLEQNKCVGCGTCAAICPKFFEMKNSLANLKNSQKNENKSELSVYVNEDDLLRLEQAEKNCPARIINIGKNQ